MTSMNGLGLSAVVALAGCMTELDERVSTANGAQLYAENCAVCHGSGRGGTATEETRTATQAPDLTLLSQRNGGVYPEIHVLATIYGPAFERAHGRLMPEFGERDLGPTVVVELEDGIGSPVPADLIALSAYLRSIQR